MKCQYNSETSLNKSGFQRARWMHLEGPTVRVLVVDDYEPFRRFVCSRLREKQGFQVIGEASDGLEAVRKAEQLQPDLMVLDIGLPSLNGIEVARRIRKLCPECKILFMSQESSVDVAQEAFNVGTMGYVVKAHAGSELLEAVEAVCQGRLFLSNGLSRHDRVDISGTQAPKPFFPQERFPPPAPAQAATTQDHAVQFYSDEAALLIGFAVFIEAALNAGTPVIVVVTESHQEGLLETLLARGIDVPAAVEQGLYLPVDVYQGLSTFMVGELPDPVRFLTIFGDLLSSASKAAKAKHPRVVACGEFSPTLWAQGNVDAAIQVEQLTDELSKTLDVDILCGYVLTSFQREHESQIYERICAEHTTVRSQ